MNISAESLNQRLIQAITETGTPGAQLAVLHGGEHFSASAGVVNINTGVEVTGDAIFQIGSITKPMTASLIMQLVDQGKVNLDAPLSEYLPELRLHSGPPPAAMTVGLMLSHASGLDGDLFTDTGGNDDCLERFVEACAEIDLLCPPGAAYSYCNAGFVLLGRLVEKLTGQVWDQALAENVLKPLGIETFATLPEEALKFRAAVGHQSDGDTTRIVDNVTLPRSGGPAGLTLAMSAAGLVGFGQMHLAGGVNQHGQRILSEQAIRHMHTPHIELIDDTRWGAGWKLIGHNRQRVVCHDGGTMGQGGYLWLIPETQTIVAALHNGPDFGGLFERLVRPLLHDLAGFDVVAPLPAPATEHGLDLDLYTGSYDNVGVRIEVTRNDREPNEGPHQTLKGVAHQKHLGQPALEFNLTPVDERLFLADFDPGGPPTVVGFLNLDGADRPSHFYAGRLHRRLVD